MSYKIVSADADSITLWDGTTTDPDHPQEPAGKMTVGVGSHNFNVGDRVDIAIRLVEAAPVDEPVKPTTIPRCARHNVHHILGPHCHT